MMNPDDAVAGAGVESGDARVSSGAGVEARHLTSGPPGHAPAVPARVACLTGLAVLWLVLAGCCGPGLGGPGITLPPGDVGRGQAAFRDLKCYFCHSVSGEEFPTPWVQPPVLVVLGTEDCPPSRRDLVNSIIKPSHRIYPGVDRERVQTNGVSRMREYDEVITIRQLSDLVAFLETLHR